tara:strand:+ start:294 stop:452 length:159 start_codon:yes stop_codon:yes gene_type:complete
MPLTTIKYTIKPNWNLEEEVQGVEGHACLRITNPMENEVGDLVSRDFLPSFL